MMNDSYLDDYEETLRESDIEDSFKKPSKEEVKDGNFVLMKYCTVSKGQLLILLG